MADERSVPPIHGLVLAGGQSTRMKRDKATLAYRGRSQLETAYDLLSGFTQSAFVSVRAEQIADPARRGFPQIVDRAGPSGPIAGIASAFAANPDVAWLVLACDLPFLDADTLAFLIARRDPRQLATAFRSTQDGLPEPLCAIYEPASREPLERYVARGAHCPRKFLLECGIELLPQPNLRALDNVNSVEEYWAAMKTLGNTPAADPIRLRVQYFALLREQAGRSDEEIATTARTPRELYEQLRGRHGFTLPLQSLRVAVNAEFGDWSQPLMSGDTVVFIPPVAGG